MNKTKRFFKLAFILVLLLVMYGIYYFERPAVIDKWVKFYPNGSIKRGTTIVEEDGVGFSGEEDGNDGLVIRKSKDECSMTYKMGTEELRITYFRGGEALQADYSQPHTTDFLSFDKDKTLSWSHSKIYPDKNNEENSGTKVEQSFASGDQTKTITVYRRNNEPVSERKSAAFPNSAQYFEPTADVAYYEKGWRQVEAWKASLRKKLNLKHPELETCDYVEKLSFSERWHNHPR